MLKDNIIASFVLVYCDLLKFLSHVKVYSLGNKTYCDLYCCMANRFDFYNIKKITTYEDNFIRSTISNKYIVLTFKVDDKYSSLLLCYAHKDYNIITEEKVKRLLRLEEKKSPATRESSRALFFKSLLYIIDFLCISVLL